MLKQVQPVARVLYFFDMNSDVFAICSMVGVRARGVISKFVVMVGRLRLTIFLLRASRNLILRVARHDCAQAATAAALWPAALLCHLVRIAVVVLIVDQSLSLAVSGGRFQLGVPCDAEKTIRLPIPAPATYDNVLYQM